MPQIADGSGEDFPNSRALGKTYSVLRRGEKVEGASRGSPCRTAPGDQKNSSSGAHDNRYVPVAPVNIVLISACS